MIFVFWWNVSSCFLSFHIRKINFPPSHIYFFYCQEEMNEDEKKHIKKKGEYAEK